MKSKKNRNFAFILENLKAKFAPELPVPKYYQIKKIFESQILEGILKPEDKLPSTSLLAETLGITRITADKSLNELKKDGLVTRSHGKGTFVTEQRSNNGNHEMIGMAMPAYGHVWGPLFQRIMETIQEHKYLCLIAPVPLYDDAPGGGKYIKTITRLIDMEPLGLIISGPARFPFYLLENFTGKMVFVVAFEGEKEYPADYILSDYFAGGKMAADHFLSLGHKKIIFWTYPVLPFHKAQLSLIAGVKTSLRENHLPEKNLVILEENKEKVLYETIREAKESIAVFCDGDARALTVYKIAKNLKKKIPSQVSVIGYYNTPWTEALEPNLTSISIKETEIADLAVQSILKGKKEKKKILIKPSLIIRESCGGKI